MMNKLNHKNSVYLVGLHIYCKMIHGPYNIKLMVFIYITVANITLREGTHISLFL